MAEKKLSKKALNKSFRNWAYGNLTCFSQEHMQTFGYLCAMLPLVEELYDTKEEQKEAMNTYTAFFNTEPQVGSIIVGITAGLEEAKANGNEDIDAEAINGIRAGLMGPLAGIGDSLAGGVIYPIGISLGCTLALQGNFSGPVIFFLMFTGIMLVLGYNLYFMGYKKGSNAVMALLGEGGNSLTKLTDAFGILGLMVVGAMGAQNVMVHLSAVINVGATEVVLQNVLDGLVLNLLPFGLIMGTWQLLKKKVSPIVVVLLLMAIGIIGYYLNILGLGV